MDLYAIGAKLAIMYVPFLFALCFHEWAHGFVAKMRGDRTAELMGRLTLNPMAHMDFIGTLLLPIMAIVTGLNIFFGWAKPVPVNERNLKNPRADMFWIALAGPLSNVFLAIVGTILVAVIQHNFVHIAILRDTQNILQFFIVINLFLAIFNLIPIHPLDGGKVLARFLPEDINRKLEASQPIMGIILLFLVISGSLRFLSVPVFMAHNFLLRLAMGGLG